MKKQLITILTAATLGASSLCLAQSDAPYTDGPVWTITMVKTKPGMDDDYLKMLAKIYKATNEEAKKQGILMDYKILLGDSSGPNDFNILLMQELPNMAALTACARNSIQSKPRSWAMPTPNARARLSAWKSAKSWVTS